MKWKDVHPETQATWLSDPTTIAYLERLREEREVSHSAALMTMRHALGSAEAHAQGSRRVGEMDAYNKAIEIAMRTE